MPIQVKELPSQARLRELLTYDPATGDFRWRVSRSPKVLAGQKAGFTAGGGYVLITVDWRAYFAHRLAWRWVYGTAPDQIDHKNGYPSDNRISNLRPSNQSQNRANSKSRADRKVPLPKGVVFDAVRKSPKKYRAQIYLARKRTVLGYFATADEAAKSYEAAAVRAFGEFARPHR